MKVETTIDFTDFEFQPHFLFKNIFKLNGMFDNVVIIIMTVVDWFLNDGVVTSQR